MTTVDQPTGWAPARQCPALVMSAVHVWRLRIASASSSLVNVDTPADAQPPSHLTPAEQARAARFRQQADRLRFALTRHRLRELLGHYLHQPPAAIAFGEGSSGKPIILHAAREEADSPGEDVRFNVSHAGEWALIAIARGRDVGVDVEQHRPLDDLEDLARRFFAPAETDALLALDATMRTAAFYRIWTRKEAFVKAMGTGIGWGLDRFIVSHDEREAVALQIPEMPADAEKWTIRALPMEEGYAAAVAFDGPACDIALWEF
jgi:4'-phosphopantetheinyl transferase